MRKNLLLLVVCLLMQSWLWAQEKVSDSFLFDGKYYVLAHFENVPDEQFRKSLPEVTWLSYRGNNTFFCAVDKNQLPELTKVASEVKGKPAAAKWLGGVSTALSEGKEKTSLDVMLTYAKSQSREKMLTTLAPFSIKEVSSLEPPQANQISVQASVADLVLLSNLPVIEALEMLVHEEDIVPFNYETNSINNAHYVKHNSALGYTGAGVVVGVGDGGRLYSHIDMDDRIVYTVNSTYSSFNDHADHVSGTIGGAGNIDPRQEGAAPGCEYVIEKTTTILSQAQNHYNNYNMVIANNSYGVGDQTYDCSNNGLYNYSSQSLDNTMGSIDELLIIFAAGNDGFQTCPPFAQGFNTVPRYYQASKNVLVVGNMQKDLTIASTSSRGPLEDGRLKPEVCAMGTDISSTLDNYNYGLKSGTSMAAPAVAGIAALMYEAYDDLFGGNAPNDVIKAVICNTSDDMGTAGPDFIHGFGLVNAKKAVEALKEARFIEGVITNSGQNIYTLTNVPNNVVGVKIMLYWNDESAASGANPTLVNDLDLSVTSNSVTHLPLILDPSAANVANPAVEGVDNVNNIEQVAYATNSTNSITVTVDGSVVVGVDQRYVFTYEYVTEDLDLTYPTGAETWVPGENEEIRWQHDTDAPGVTYTVSYAENGTTWVQQATGVTGNTLIWSVPNDITDDARIRIESSDGSISTSDAFVIMAVPQNLQTDCGIFTWDAVPGAIGYEVFMLDGPYMEHIVTTSGTSYNIIYNNGASEQWISVAAILPGNEISRRAVAIPFDEVWCPEPTNLQSSVYYGIISGVWATFYWNPGVSDYINGYVLTITYNDPFCCGGDGIPTVQSIFVPGTQSQYTLALSSETCCFSWKVESACRGRYCLAHSTPAQCIKACKYKDFDIPNGKMAVGEKESFSEAYVKVVPNPSRGAVSLMLNTEKSLFMSIEIYSIDGRLVDQIDEQQYDAGTHDQVWNGNGDVTPGTYIFLFKTQEGAFHKRVVIQP